MFLRFAVYAERAPHASPVQEAETDDGPDPSRIRPRIGTAFEHSDGAVAVYLDALPVTGRLLLVPEDHEPRRGGR